MSIYKYGEEYCQTIYKLKKLLLGFCPSWQIWCWGFVLDGKIGAGVLS